MRKIFRFHIQKNKWSPTSYSEWNQSEFLLPNVHKILPKLLSQKMWLKARIRMHPQLNLLRTLTLKFWIPVILFALRSFPSNPYVHPCRRLSISLSFPFSPAGHTSPLFTFRKHQSMRPVHYIDPNKKMFKSSNKQQVITSSSCLKFCLQKFCSKIAEVNLTNKKKTLLQCFLQIRRITLNKNLRTNIYYQPAIIISVIY